MAHTPEDCKEVVALLSEYLDFELPADICEQIGTHLAECSPCVDFAESLQKTIDLCRGYEPGVMPGPLSQDARAELEKAWHKMLAARGSKTTT